MVWRHTKFKLGFVIFFQNWLIVLTSIRYKGRVRTKVKGGAVMRVFYLDQKSKGVCDLFVCWFLIFEQSREREYV